MIFFISDAHLGRIDRQTDRDVEHDLIACLKHHREAVEHVYLVGDLFDAYIEYGRLVPKGATRLKGLLASWTDAGIPVTCLVGNHDPWHIDYFETELGVHVATGPILRQHYGYTLHLAHGDLLPGEPPVKNGFNRLLRHPIPVWMFRSLLPGDVGMRLAQAVSRVSGQRPIDPRVVEALRTEAHRILLREPVDLVVFGHTHHAECRTWQEGTYLNTGAWCTTRTFGQLDEHGPKLLQWNGRSADGV